MRRMVLTIFFTVITALSAIAQVGSRLVSEAFYLYNGSSGSFTLRDTVDYQYSGANGPDKTFSWKFDTSVTQRQTNGSFVKHYRRALSFDAQNRVVAHYEEGWNVTSNKWETTQKTAVTYDSQGKIALWEYQSPNGANWDTYVRYTHTYNNNGDPLETIMQEKTAGSTGPLINFARDVYVFDAAGKKVSDTSYEWNASSWAYKYFERYFYTGSSLTSMSRYTFDGVSGGWKTEDSTIYTYDSKGREIKAETKRIENGIWKSWGEMTSVYDTSGNMLSWTFLNPEEESGWQRTVTYNTLNQPLTSTYKRWDAISGQFEFAINGGVWHHHYAPYTTGVSNMASQANTIHLFPNPANDVLLLNLSWNETQPATIMLFDMTGKVAGHWTIPSATQHTQSLDISNVPSGTYMLKVMGTKGTMHQQVNIVR